MAPSCLSTATLALRPLIRTTQAFLSTSTPQFLPHITRRTEATTRRLTKKLRIKPAPEFTNTTIPHDHIVFNPPSSLPNIYHTPLKFLPPSDPRRALLASNAETAPTKRRGPLPTPVRNPGDKIYTLGKEEIEEIKRLRNEDPMTWTRKKLAVKFGCSPYFVAICVQSGKAIQAHRDRDEAIKKKWGRKKTEAREDRQRRRDLWGRDE